MMLLPRESSYTEREKVAFLRLIRWAEEMAVREKQMEDSGQEADCEGNGAGFTKQPTQ